MSTPKIYALITEDSQGFRIHKLEQVICRVGRSRCSDIQLPSADISRHHAIFLRIPSQNDQPEYRLIDGDPQTRKLSTNGTYINGRKIISSTLKDKDEVTFGGSVKGRFVCLSLTELKGFKNSNSEILLNRKSDLYLPEKKSSLALVRNSIPQLLDGIKPTAIGISIQ